MMCIWIIEVLLSERSIILRIDLLWAHIMIQKLITRHVVGNLVCCLLWWLELLIMRRQIPLSHIQLLSTTLMHPHVLYHMSLRRRRILRSFRPCLCDLLLLCKLVGRRGLFVLLEQRVVDLGVFQILWLLNALFFWVQNWGLFIHFNTCIIKTALIGLRHMLSNISKALLGIVL